MGSIVGFSVRFNISIEQQKSARVAQGRVLTRFEHLEITSLTIGESVVEIGGHRDVSDRVHRLSNGSLMVLIGSPLGEVSWQKLEEALRVESGFTRFEPPWDGRFVLLHISADGKRWTMWNDWIGSIPVFHARLSSGGRIASTIEPVLVASAGFTPDDFFMPGLASLLIHGHYLADWTLYKEMKIIPPDSRSTWDDEGARVNCLWTVQPSRDRWETSWDDLVDEMHELSQRAIVSVLNTQPAWILPLSSGLDSRLIAGVAADHGADVSTYAWGASNTTDVIYSRQIAKTLGYPWKHVDLGTDYLVRYTKPWADLFGSALHFHGMYQMAFLDAIQQERAGSILSGFIGETLAGEDLSSTVLFHSNSDRYQLYSDWYMHWAANEIESLLKFPASEILREIAVEFRKQFDAFPGARFQKIRILELWSRQRLFINFQSILADYWRGVATPYLNRAYARFCLSLPMAALDRRLLGDVFRRYYGRLAVIPGTYAHDPYILTGQYLIKRRIARKLPESLRSGLFAGFHTVPLRMDLESIQVTGKDSLWPIYEVQENLSKWLEFSQVETAFHAVMNNREDIRPLRKLQSVQTLAFRLLKT